MISAKIQPEAGTYQLVIQGFLDQGRRDEALQVFDEAIEKQLNFPDAFVTRVMGKKVKAADATQKQSEMTPAPTASVATTKKSGLKEKHTKSNTAQAK